MLKKLSNPYDVLSETISFENVQQIGELITLKCLRGYCAYTLSSLNSRLSTLMEKGNLNTATYRP